VIEDASLRCCPSISPLHPASWCSFWITHPNNTVIGNRAAGSEAYGYWYRLQDNSDGERMRMGWVLLGM